VAVPGGPHGVDGIAERVDERPFRPEAPGRRDSDVLTAQEDGGGEAGQRP
jgi:hypothetical protein